MVDKKKEEKNPLGRPTKYLETYPDDLIKWFDRPYTIAKTKKDKDGKDVEIGISESCDIPTVYGFCARIGIHTDTFYEWTAKYPDFSGAHKRAMQFQKDIIVNNAMKGDVNPTFAIFFAKCNWKWNDKAGEQAEPKQIEVIIKEFDDSKDS